MMKQRVWVWFGLYCLFSASVWLLPTTASWIRCGIFTTVGIVALAVNGSKPWNRSRDVFGLGLTAILLWGVPELLAEWSQRHISSVLGTAVLGSVPIMIVLVAAQRGVDDRADGRRLLVPAVAGLGGLLLVIPVGLPGSVIGWLATVVFMVSAVITAVASVEMYRLSRDFSLVQSVAIFCLANAFVLGGAGFLEQSMQWTLSLGGIVSCAATSGSVVLLVLLLREMEPVRFAARYLVVPLLTILEGYVLLRPDLTLRLEFGVGLLAVGAGFLLLSRRTDEVSSLSLH